MEQGPKKFGERRHCSSIIFTRWQH